MFVFAIMPFDDEFNSLYEDVIRPTFEKSGYEVARADKLNRHDNILKGIIESLHRADLVIAETTTENANVFYELGIAHALNKPTLILTQEVETLPFDIRLQRVIPYSTNFVVIKKLEDQLKDIATGLKNNEVKFGNFVSDILNSASQVSPMGHQLSAVVSYSYTGQLDQNEFAGAEPGFWDYVVEAVASMEQIGVRMGRFVELTTDLNADVTAQSVKIKNAQQPGVSGAALKIHNAISAVAEKLNRYCDNLEGEIPELEKDWNSIRNNILGLLIIENIKTPQDVEAVHNFRDIVDGLLNIMTSTIPSLEGMRSSITAVHGLSKSLNYSVKKSEATLDRLIATLVVGRAYIVEILSSVEQLISPNTITE